MASRTKTIVRNRNGRLIAPHFAVLSFMLIHFLMLSSLIVLLLKVR